mmetsp:Transcript_17102/g.46349  ORF Transcript_17102/g.46349 Transcript_17102/m.46349 type:complete len:156 (-) Transcript_17102:533-1000(-)
MRRVGLCFDWRDAVLSWVTGKESPAVRRLPNLQGAILLFFSVLSGLRLAERALKWVEDLKGCYEAEDHVPQLQLKWTPRFYIIWPSVKRRQPGNFQKHTILDKTDPDKPTAVLLDLAHILPVSADVWLFKLLVVGFLWRHPRTSASAKYQRHILT